MNQNEIQVGRLVYMGDWSPENLTAVREVLDPLAFFIPHWVVTCSVWWNTSNEEAAIRSSIEYDYRRAQLEFFPDFVGVPSTKRRYLVIRDLIHAFTSVVVDYASDTIESLLPENESPKFREHALRELTVRNESATQDLAYCLEQWLTSQSKP